MQDEPLHPSIDDIVKAAYSKVGVNVEKPAEPAEHVDPPTTPAEDPVKDVVQETRTSEPEKIGDKAAYKTRASKKAE